MPNETIKLPRSILWLPNGAVGFKPRGSILTAVLICMLVSNNVLAKCSSECSFLLPSHETSATLGSGALIMPLPSRTWAANGTKNNQDTHACHFCVPHIGVECYFN